ncbi:MAG: TetR family transcriptional regulator [Sphingomonadaceae bacterium]
MSITRTRLSAEDSRLAALEAARALLIEEGPQAVTLKAVAARIGRTHANLLHHFGSAAGLQQALAARMAERITAQIGAAVLKARAGETDQREIIDLTFDAFGKEGAGALASWAILSGERSALDTIVEAIHRLVDELGPHEGRPLHAITLSLVLTALGDALMGDAMANALGLPRGTAREMMLAQMHSYIGKPA